MPDYNVVFEIDACGTRIDHRVEDADNEHEAQVRATRERHHAGRAGYVVAIEEVKHGSR